MRRGFITALAISLIAGVATAPVNMTSAEVDLIVAMLTPVVVTIAFWPEMRASITGRTRRMRRR
jgi:hypothetical protein